MSKKLQDLRKRVIHDEPFSLEEVREALMELFMLREGKFDAATKRAQDKLEKSSTTKSRRKPKQTSALGDLLRGKKG